MKVKDAQFFTVVSSFLNVYLVKNRSCSSNTVKSYEDALNLLFTFLEGTKDIPRQRVNWSHFTRQNIQEFVDWLEKVRNCSRQTQLQRLAAIRSFVRYGGIVDLRVIAIQADVERIRYRKPPPALVGYLTKEELSIFLAQPNCKKRTGFRNMVFLVLMYDTAARCQEMLDLRIQDLVLHRTSPCVYFTGKGNKTRVVPILPKTAEHLRSYLKKFHPAENRKRDDYVFYAYGGPQRPMSPDTVAAFVKKYGESARHVCTSIPERVHPHMLRHTRAMHLSLQSICPTCPLFCWTRVSSPPPSQPLFARAKSVLSAMPALPKEHRWCIRNERGRKAACTLQKIFWTWIISRNSPAMTAAGFVCRSPARAIAFCARIAATSNICEIP